MSDGELKKRIHAVAYHYIGDEPIMLTTDMVDHILDEAKKEFPKPKSEHFDNKAGLRGDLLQIAKWLEKWFGDYP